MKTIIIGLKLLRFALSREKFLFNTTKYGPWYKPGKTVNDSIHGKMVITRVKMSKPSIYTENTYWGIYGKKHYDR